MSDSNETRATPQQARAHARRAAVVNAAVELVHEIGIDQTTTGKIADRANVSIGTVYRYFPDVYAILNEILPGREQIEDVLLERAEQIAKGYDAEHDDAHGVEELLWEADRRARRYGSLVTGGDRSDLVAAIAIGLAALEVHDRANLVQEARS